MNRPSVLILTAALSLVASGLARADEPRHVIESYVVPSGPTSGALDATTVLHLAIGLPSRDPDGLRAFADAVSSREVPQYRHFLTLDALTDRFGPTAANYEALAAWAAANHLTVEDDFRPPTARGRRRGRRR